MSTHVLETDGPAEGFAVREIRDAEELRLAMDLRRRVFCEEQGVPVRDEVDGRDPEGLHLIAVEGARVVGACRLIFQGTTTQFSRLAVEADCRRRGIATALLEAADAASRAKRSRKIVLHAQTYAVELYENAGYRTRGTTFRDAGIEHIAMEKRIG